MTQRHKVQTKEIGLVRIYLTQGEKKRMPGLLGWLTAKPLSHEIIQAAKEDGVPHAVAHFSHYGYTSAGAIEGEISETPNPRLNMYADLIGPREKLEEFCSRRERLLKGKLIVYTQMERWDSFHDEAV